MKPKTLKQFPEKQGNQKAGYKRPPIHTRFKKGASGNPGGVKKGTVFIAEAYKRLLSMAPDELKKYRPQSVAERIALEQVQNACGDGVEQQSLPAAREITDRTEGKAPQTVNLTGEIQIESSESRREWAEKKLAELMKSHKLSRAAAIKELRAIGAMKTLEYLGEA
jgi:hypothetical protein